MKKNILPAVKLTVILMILLAVIYPLFIWGIAQFSTGSGKGQVIVQNGKTYYVNIGQKFTDDKYFWSRPSAVDYNAAGSGSSNKGPSNEKYLQHMQARIDTFMVHNLGVKRSQIPVDMVTASGSGLDPDISVEAANVQIKRIAKAQGIAEGNLEQLVLSNTERPFLYWFGPEKVNVLKLNIALDDLQ